MNNRRIKDFSRLCIHTITTKPWSLEEAAKKYSDTGITGISVWRDTLEGSDIKSKGQMLREYGLQIVSLVRGGFFASANETKRTNAIKDNQKAIDDAHTLGAPLLVLVCGADPKQSFDKSKEQISYGIKKILPKAESLGIKLGIEPLHPMYADSRSAITTLKQANDFVEKLNSPWLGVVIDVYHVWWDPMLIKEILRCGKLGKIFAFHINDWKVPTEDLLYDRGLMGEGCIDIPKIRNCVENAGFDGFHEVEIFSTKYWQSDQDEFLEKIKEAYLKYV
jgi:sugar phosphate isomerase/epimerase